jgi:hypothetical protein
MGIIHNFMCLNQPGGLSRLNLEKETGVQKSGDA